MTMNPLSALTRSGTATMLGNAEVRELCVLMMQEMQLCGARLDLRIDMTPEERIGIALRLGNFKTSMLADCRRGGRWSLLRNSAPSLRSPAGWASLRLFRGRFWAWPR